MQVKAEKIRVLSKEVLFKHNSVKYTLLSLPIVFLVVQIVLGFCPVMIRGYLPNTDAISIISGPFLEGLCSFSWFFFLIPLCIAVILSVVYLIIPNLILSIINNVLDIYFVAFSIFAIIQYNYLVAGAILTLENMLFLVLSNALLLCLEINERIQQKRLMNQ